MKGDPCSVCGGTDLNLVDGYYYCVECGTQDDNVRETVVDFTIVNELIMRTTKKKIANEQGPQMSSEWYRWHTYNFILSGLTEEVMALGARPSFKVKLLWVWARYIKMFQVNEDGESEYNKQKRKIENKIEESFNNSGHSSDNEQPSSKQHGHKFNKNNKHKRNGKNQIEETSSDSDDDDSDDEPLASKQHALRSDKQNKINNTIEDISDESDNYWPRRERSITNMSVSVMHAMIYVALNLDESDIQLSHILKYLRDGRISFAGCIKYIPKQMKVKEIPSWSTFIKSTRHPQASDSLGSLVMDLFDILKLGTFNTPNMKKIVDNFIKELCLPEDFSKLVHSLMYKIKWRDQIQKWTPRVQFMPKYEALAMAYIVMALKICFGLDDEYEITLSDAVERVNELNNYSKSYTFDSFNEDTSRLFSFREWITYLQFRKIVLCKYYSGHALQHNRDLDDYLFIAQSHHQPKLLKMKEVGSLTHEVTMDIIKKVSTQNEELETFKIEFPPSLTPISTYTNILSEKVEDPDLKLLLSENFFKYSIRYAASDLKLPYEEKDNVITGVRKDNKLFNMRITWDRRIKGYDIDMVYVRNCDNKNWMYTNQPEAKHFSKELNVENVDKTIDCEYDSSRDTEAKATAKEENTEIITDIIEEDTEYNIFDDNFEDETNTCPDDFDNLNHEVYNEYESPDNNEYKTQDFNEYDQETQDLNISTEINDSKEIMPEEFDREQAIKYLVTVACKEHRITLPKEYKPEVVRKRKTKNRETQAVEAKRRKVTREEKTDAQAEISTLIHAYNSQVAWNTFQQTNINFSNLPTDISNQSLKNNIDDEPQNDMNVSKDALSINDHTLPQEIDNEQSDNTLEKSNFDEEIYETKQLYVKCKESDIETYLDGDRKLDELLSAVIDKVPNDKDNNDNNITNVKNQKKDDKTKEHKPKKYLFRPETIGKERKLKNRETINYWIKAYMSEKIRRERILFEEELNNNIPKSLFFILQICSTISESPVMDIYKLLTVLERKYFNLDIEIRNA